MKSMLNLSIDEDILLRAKLHAIKNNVSLSKLVEDYLETIVINSTYETLIEFLDRLEVPKIDKNIDFKKQYYIDRAEKYGFKNK